MADELASEEHQPEVTGEGDASRSKESSASPSQLGAVLIAGLLALFGKIAGGILKGRLDNQLADKKFQTDLVMKALEPAKQEERINSLRFLIDTNLISDPVICNGVKSYLKEKSNVVPQFKAPLGTYTPSIVVPSTPETIGFTDFNVYVCKKEWSNPAAQALAHSVIGALSIAGQVGQFKLLPWSAYEEVPLEKLRNKLTIIYDKGRGEERELERLRLLLGKDKFPEIQPLENTGKPSPWLLSVIVCPT
jgi:hypothetical protein